MSWLEKSQYIRDHQMDNGLNDDVVYQPLSEENFFERLAIARQHAEEGKVMDARKAATVVQAALRGEDIIGSYDTVDELMEVLNA